MTTCRMVGLFMITVDGVFVMFQEKQLGVVAVSSRYYLNFTQNQIRNETGLIEHHSTTLKPNHVSP